MDTLEPGDIVILVIQGAVESKARPVVVLSRVQYHKEHPDVVVGLLTTQLHQATTSTDYVLQDWLAARLVRPSAFRTFLVTRPRSEIGQYVGRLSERDWDAVKERLRSALEVDRD